MFSLKSVKDIVKKLEKEKPEKKEKSEKGEKPEKKSKKALEPCPPGKFRNKFTNRCKEIPDVKGKKQCKANQILNPETGKCVSITGKIGQKLRGF